LSDAYNKAYTFVVERQQQKPFTANSPDNDHINAQAVEALSALPQLGSGKFQENRATR
jgi:hypothetical protein